MRKSDKAVIALYTILLLVGIWHAFPSLKVVGDEAPYVGGVLRAMQDKTLIPDIDYSYTLSFYANYFLMVLFVGIIVIFSGGVAQATSFLMDNVYLAYLIPRLVSVISTVVLLVFFLKFAESKGRTLTERVILSSIVFLNIIFFSIAHTGKMWMLSLLLWFLTFYFFDKARESLTPKFLVLTPIFAFLALANFPVNIIALIFPAWLWVETIERRGSIKYLAFGTGLGILLFALFFALNYGGWIFQNSVTPAYGGDVVGIIKYFVSGALLLIPIHLLFVFLCFRDVRIDRSFLAILSSLVAYVAIVALRAPWVGAGAGEAYFRYFVYIGFILGVLLVYGSISRMGVAKTLAIVSLIFAIRADYLLSIPTTHNLVRDYVEANAEDTLVINNYPYLDLNKNRESYLITQDSLCQSKCLYRRNSQDVTKGLFVIDSETDKSEFERVRRENQKHLLVSAEEEDYIGIDYNLGPYSLELFKIDYLGPKFFVNKVP